MLTKKERKMGNFIAKRKAELQDQLQEVKKAMGSTYQNRGDYKPCQCREEATVSGKIAMILEIENELKF